MAIPSPVATAGFVVLSYIWPAPPVARMVALAKRLIGRPSFTIYAPQHLFVIHNQVGGECKGIFLHDW